MFGNIPNIGMKVELPQAGFGGLFGRVTKQSGFFHSNRPRASSSPAIAA
jgi:hypothetical protein